MPQPPPKPVPAPPKPGKPPKRTKPGAAGTTIPVTVSAADGTVLATDQWFQWPCALDTCTATTTDPDGDGWTRVSVSTPELDATGGQIMVMFDALAHFVEWAGAQA